MKGGHSSRDLRRLAERFRLKCSITMQSMHTAVPPKYSSPDVAPLR